MFGQRPAAGFGDVDALQGVVGSAALCRRTPFQFLECGSQRAVLVVDEDYLSYGMSGELVAIVAEDALDYLDAPPKRLAVPDVPIPYSRPMEQYVIPSIDRIVAAAKELVNG